jgi:hypothetical protein
MLIANTACDHSSRLRGFNFTPFQSIILSKSNILLLKLETNGDTIDQGAPAIGDMI